MRPDGITDAQIDRGHRGSGAKLLSLFVLGGVLAIGLSGLAGGTDDRMADDAGAAVRFDLTMPTTARSGSVLESRLTVTAKQPVRKLVIGIDPALWRQLTTNSIEPAAAEETFSDGLLRLTFGELAAGDRFELQIAQQANPALWGRNRGRFVVFDDTRPLAEIPVRLTVLP